MLKYIFYHAEKVGSRKLYYCHVRSYVTNIF